MSDLTVKQLKTMIKKHKNQGAKCKPYSKMRKSELIKHAKELGLIKTKKGPSAEDKRIKKNLDKLLSIKNLVENQEPTSVTGKKKKTSTLRRIERVRAAIEKGENQPKVDAFLKKLNKDADKVVLSL